MNMFYLDPEFTLKKNKNVDCDSMEENVVENT